MSNSKLLIMIILMIDKLQIKYTTLYLGDCVEVFPLLTKADAVVTDPPYGIGEAAGKNKSRSKIAIAKDYGNDLWFIRRTRAPGLKRRTC